MKWPKNENTNAHNTDVSGIKMLDTPVLECDLSHLFLVMHFISILHRKKIIIVVSVDWVRKSVRVRVRVCVCVHVCVRARVCASVRV